MYRVIKIALSLAVLALALCNYVFYRKCVTVRKLYAALPSLDWGLLVLIGVCLGGLIFLDFSIADLALVGLVSIAAVSPLFFHNHQIGPDALVLVLGALMGKVVRLLFRKTITAQKQGLDKREITSQLAMAPPNAPLHSSDDAYFFLVGFSVLLAVTACCQLHLPNAFYSGPRWMGIWDNPNEYGVLMGTGVVLAAGLLAIRKAPEEREKKSFFVTLIIAAGMTAMGLCFSYSRGAWVGLAIGLTYLAGMYGKLNWRYALPGFVAIAAVFLIFWDRTPDSAPWYLKRMDFGRPSAQHRVSAWKAGFKIMLDHPLGVGWENSIDVYQTNYSPPQGGAGAIATNDYLMLGTQLGLPGLLCFLAYVALCLKDPGSRVRATKVEPKSRSKINKPKLAGASRVGISSLDGLQISCRAAALSMLAAFWFDAGLFRLATAAVFWILLELGRARRNQPKENPQFITEDVRGEVKSAPDIPTGSGFI